MGAGTATGSQVNIPQGCKKVENEYSVQIVCEQNQQFSNLKADKEKSCVQSGGKFYVREDGSFDCSFEGTQGFFQQGQCPASEEQAKREQECASRGGFIERFRDKNGCEALSCKEQFNQEFRSEEEKIKFKAVACEESGGQFIMNEQGPQCFGGTHEIRANKELKPLDGIELLKIALEMENIIQTFNEISAKLSSLQSYYQSKGDEEKAKAFEIAISQMDGALTRLDEIRIGLAENADSLQEEDRYAVLGDMQQINSIIKDVAVTLLTGGKSKRAATQRFEKEAIKEGISPEQGQDILQAFKKCADFSEESPFKFSPEPGTNVRLEGLDNGKCIMIVNPPGAPMEVTFKLPSGVYQFFDNPQLLLRDDVECSPESACQMMKQYLSSGNQGNQQQVERFGEKERIERYGIEYGRLGCNAEGSTDKLRADCESQNQVACEIEVPGCAPWIVCNNPQSACPPKNYCSINPSACPSGEEIKTERVGQTQRIDQAQKVERIQGPEFPESRGAFDSQYAFGQNPSGQYQPTSSGGGGQGYSTGYNNEFIQYADGTGPNSFNQPQYQQPMDYAKQTTSSGKAGYCGDNVIAVSLGEECDDGNQQSGDGCFNCRLEQQPEQQEPVSQEPVAIANIIKNVGSWMRGEI